MTELLDFDTVALHESVGPFRYKIPADVNGRRLASLGTTDRKWLRTAEGRELVEPSMLVGQHSWTMRRRYHWDGSVHAKCEAEFLAPVYAGSTIEVTSEVIGKYERRGGKYVEFQLDTRDETGKLATRVRNTMLLNFAEVNATRRPNAAMAPAGTAEDRPEGTELVFGPRLFDRNAFIAFFRCEEDVYGDFPSIHNVAEIAHKLGLRDIIAPGRYSIGMMSGPLFEFLGPGWVDGARYSVAIRNNFLPGIRAMTRVRLIEPPPGAAPAGREFSFECRDVDSGRVLVSGTLALAS